MRMKKYWLMPLLILALLLAACADDGAAQTPGALGTEPLGTDTGLATDTGLETAAVTEALEPTMAVTEAATEAVTAEATMAATGTPEAQVTAEVETGIVAAPFNLFTVASLTGETGTGGDTGGTGTGAATPAAGTQQPAGTQDATTGTQTAGGMETEEDRLLVRASELLGSDIVDSNGEVIGTVDEVLVDEAGMVQYVVFDANDFLNAAGTGTGTGGDTGTGANTPEPAGTAENDNSTQVVGTIEPQGTAAAGTPEAIGTSTVGEGTAMPETNVGVTADENTILVFNGTASDLEAQAVMLPEGLLDADGITIMVDGTDMPADMSNLEGLVRMTQVTNGNANVLDAQDQDLGEVEDLLVDIRQGMVEYGVVDFGGFLGIAENTVAVPWEQFALGATAGAEASTDLRLDVTEETLQNAPILDIGDWPSWPNQIPMEWETETQTFWETAS